MQERTVLGQLSMQASPSCSWFQYADLVAFSTTVLIVVSSVSYLGSCSSGSANLVIYFQAAPVSEDFNLVAIGRKIVL